MPASAIEALVPKLFATPSPDVSAQTRIIFEHVARIWDDLIVPNRRRELVSLCNEIRWDGERSKVTILADEVGIANWVESWRQIRPREAAAARG